MKMTIYLMTYMLLTAAAGLEQFPVLSPDGKRVAYVRDYNVYVLDLPSGLEHQLDRLLR